MVELEIPMYLTGEEIQKLEKENEEVIATFLDAGGYKTFKGDSGDRQVFQIDIKLPDGEQRTWSPNLTSQRKIAAEYGQNTDEWEGKQVKLEATKQNVRGETKLVVYGSPIPEKGPKPSKSIEEF